MKSIFIFRRDYRLDDNLGWIESLKNSDEVLPIFIFTPEQSKRSENKYFSDNSFQFLVESLKELSETLPHGLTLFQDDNIDALRHLRQKFAFEAVYTNYDYTPYAIDRDQKIADYCEGEGIVFHKVEDYLLMPLGTFLKPNDQKPYTKYTPFKNNAYKFTIPRPIKCSATLLRKVARPPPGLNSVPWSKIEELYEENPHIIYHGGRREGLKRLRKIRDFRKYGEERNILSKPTTLLSAHIHFGTLSIRECFWKIREELGNKHPLLDQLLWREFWYYIGFYFPHVINYKGRNRNMWPEYDRIEWKNPRRAFEAWCEGRTGFPAVDAGMRELNQTGYMHNRARLITSGILVKNFGVDWRWGELYYSEKLIDISPPVNSGNWQWSASTGENKGEYYRIMNPWTQSAKFDKEAEYIKYWVPELRDVPAKDIHQWGDVYQNYPDVNYPKPVIDYTPQMRKEIMEMYKRAIR